MKEKKYDIVESLEKGFDLIGKKIDKFSENFNDYNEKRNEHWKVTRGQEVKVELVEEKVDLLEEKVAHLDDDLNSKSDTRPGVIIQFNRMIVKNEANFNELKCELKNFKNFIMKIIWTISGGATGVILVFKLINYIISINK